MPVADRPAKSEASTATPETPTAEADRPVEPVEAEQAGGLPGTPAAAVQGGNAAEESISCTGPEAGLEEWEAFLAEPWTAVQLMHSRLQAVPYHPVLLAHLARVLLEGLNGKVHSQATQSHHRGQSQAYLLILFHSSDAGAPQGFAQLGALVVGVVPDCWLCVSQAGGQPLLAGDMDTAACALSVVLFLLHADGQEDGEAHASPQLGAKKLLKCLKALRQCPVVPLMASIPLCLMTLLQASPALVALG